MEVAKISSKGQITIPVSVRNALKLKAGDKIVILEENGRFYFENSAMLAFKRAEELALAMEARCYHGGENRTRLKVFKLGGIDYIAMLIIAAQIVFIALGY